GEQKPNTQLSVSVANLARDPNAPFIVFGKAEALKGQGAPVGWNPYVVAAKFVINQVESATDIETLAKEIIQTIMQNKRIGEETAFAANQWADAARGEGGARRPRRRGRRASALAVLRERVALDRRDRARAERSLLAARAPPPRAARPRSGRAAGLPR